MSGPHNCETERAEHMDPSEQDRLGSLDDTRRRFEEAGRFPVRKVVFIAVAAAVVIFGLFAGYQRYQQSKEAGGVVVVNDVEYPGTQIPMTEIDSAEQTSADISFPRDELTSDYIVGFTYQRETPMPEGYQMAAGGNILPLIAYVAPSGRLVVGTSFCEPCRSTTFTIDENQLVCDVCYTRWDLNTLMGIGGGCFDYPPEEVAAEVRGDRVVVPAADLEAWVPRAYQEEQIPEDMPAQ